MFEHAQGGGYSERTVDGWLYREPCRQGGLVNYQEREVEGTVGESE